MTADHPDWFDPSPLPDMQPPPAPLGFGVIADQPLAASLIATIPGLEVAAEAPPHGTGWAAIVDPGRVEALLIDAPVSTRAAMVQDALAVGVPVMVRGAPASDIAEMETIRRLAKLSDGLVMAWFPLLFEPAIAALRELGEMVGPVRGLGFHRHGRADLSASDLIWEAAADPVALCLDMLNAKPTWQGAERLPDGTLSLRLLFPGDISARIDLTSGPGPMPDAVAVFRDPVVMVWRADDGLTLHPPRPGATDLTPPTGPGEPVETPDPGGPAMAVRTFAHMVMEREPQPQMLDFAADVTAVLAACVESLAE